MSQVPFFLWLENHPVCTASPGLDDKWSETLRRVKMTKYGKHPSEMFTIQVDQGCLRCVPVDSAPERATTEQFDTKSAVIVKGDPKPGGQYAFIWATDEHIYTAAHKAGTLHHSSFTRGYKVKAAGMWTVTNGKVKYVDDNTGHYQTDAFRLYAFCEYLHKSGVVDADAEIRARTLGQDSMKIRDFLASYSDRTKLQTLRTTPSLLEIKAPTPRVAAAAGTAGDAKGGQPAFAFKTGLKFPVGKKKDQ